ncbi:MAG: hypothetical protein ACYTGI_02365 [Planctomycetota bacterium]|jgi:hypothetical protein
MLKKPQDLLEFFRRSSGDRPEAAAPQDLEKTPRMLVVRRSQAVVAAVSAGLGLVLAFLLGLGLGGASSDPAVAGGGLWVIKVVSYEDNDKGRRYTKTVMSQLERLDLGDEVNLSRVVSDGKLAVTLGTWRRRPHGDPRAQQLLDKVKGITGRAGQGQPFASADFWRIER